MTRPLKVFPSTLPTVAGQRLSHAHIIPLWDADATRVRTLHNRLVADGVGSCLDKVR